MSADRADVAATLRTLNAVLATAAALLDQLATGLAADEGADPDELLTLDQAEPLTGLNRRTLGEMCADRRLPCYRPGHAKVWRIRRRDLASWLERFHTGASGA